MILPSRKAQSLRWIYKYNPKSQTLILYRTMKNTNILSLSWFLVLAIFLAIHCPSSSNAEEDELDCDTYLCDDAFEYVKAGQPYYFGPPLKSQGGDIALKNTTPSVYDDEVGCPREAVVLPSGSNGGGRFIFNPIVPDEKGRVPLARALAISSGEEEECEEETGVLQMKKKSKVWYMTADGTANTAASCFQFLKHTKPSDPENKDSYFLQNCPYLCGTGTIGYCQNVGNVSSGGNNTNTNWKYYLTATTKQPFEISIRGNWETDASIRIRTRSS